MSTLEKFLKTTYNRGVLWWVKFYWNNILLNIYTQKPKQNNKDWVGIKVNRSIIPEGWSKEQAFTYLNEQYSKESRIMLGYKDKK